MPAARTLASQSTHSVVCALIVFIAAAMQGARAMNVLGQPLKCCCLKPRTGFYRDGYCNTGANDMGAHVVCAKVTKDFLDYTAAQGNDLRGGVGLQPGDRWCLCASRWKEAKEAGKAPPIYLDGCHEKSLQYVTMDELKEFALAGDEAVEATEEEPAPNAELRK